LINENPGPGRYETQL